MGDQGEDVLLYVYDLSNGLASALSPQLLGKQIDGIWHSSIVVGGTEYYFGGGVQQAPAGRTPFGTPIQTFSLGTTHVPADLRGDYIEELKTVFTPESYNLLTHNCNNFSNELAMFLTGESIPAHITSLPAEVMATPFGQMMLPMLGGLQAQLGSVQQGASGSSDAPSGPAAASQPAPEHKPAPALRASAIEVESAIGRASQQRAGTAVPGPQSAPRRPPPAVGYPPGPGSPPPAEARRNSESESLDLPLGAELGPGEEVEVADEYDTDSVLDDAEELQRRVRGIALFSPPPTPRDRPPRGPFSSVDKQPSSGLGLYGGGFPSSGRLSSLPSFASEAGLTAIPEDASAARRQRSSAAPRFLGRSHASFAESLGGSEHLSQGSSCNAEDASRPEAREMTIAAQTRIIFETAVRQEFGRIMAAGNVTANEAAELALRRVAANASA